MFERMEMAEEIYEGVSPSKNNQQAEADRSSSGRNKNGGASTSPSNTKQGRAGKRKISNAGHLGDEPTGANNTCLLHILGHSSEECKTLQDYIEKCLAQYNYKEKQACSGSNECGKTVKFEGASEEPNVIKSHDEPTPRKKTRNRDNKKPKIDQANADPSEDEHNYELDRLNLG